MHTPTVGPGDADPVDGEATGYTPPQDAEAIKLQTAKPSVKTLDKKKVALVGGAFGAALLFAFVAAFSPTEHKAAKEQPTAQPETQEAENLNTLPGDYKKLAQQRAEQTPQLGPPMPGDLGSMRLAQQREFAAGSAGDPALNGAGQMTPMQQLAQQQAMARLQRAASARNAAPSFDRGGGAGGSPVGAGAAADPLAALSQRLAAGMTPPMMGGNGPGGSPSNKTARDDANRQDDKQSFLDDRELGDVQLHTRLLPAPSSFVGAGTIIPALFLTGVNSDLPGMLTAQVAQPVYDTVTGRHVLIPQGAVLIGQYDSRVTFGQNRVLLVWQRIRFPDGTSLSLEGMPGIDMSGYAGVKDKVNNHWGKLIGAVVMSSLLSASAGSSQGDTYSVTNPSLSQQAAIAAGASINQAGQKIVERALNVQPTLEIRPGQRVAVMVSKDLILPTYE